MAEISHGQVNLNTVLGAIGTAGAVAPNLFGGILGGMGSNCNSENMPVNRYEMSLLQENAALKADVKFRDSEIYTDNKLEAFNDRIECRFRGIENRLAEQAVWNATQTGTLSCVAQQIAALNSLTKIIVPADNVCPPPMPLYNSWTAPTTTTTGT